MERCWAERSACFTLARACNERADAKIISDAVKLFSVRSLIPENCEYCVAVGAIEQSS